MRKLAGSGEERLGLDRLSGKPITLRVYPRPRPGNAVPEALAGPAPHLAQPLGVVREQGEAIVARELAFGPSLEDLLVLGPQSPGIVSSLLHQLLEGLAGLHAAGRAHLRLSPAAIRFDLLAGVLKITDLEQGLLEADAPNDLIPRFLEPEIRSGVGRPANDIYSVGRIGEALLRGGAPLGPWGAGAGVPGPLWDFVQRCQSASEVERPRDATEALAQLDRLGLPQAPALTLPLGNFVRRHVRALRELRRWRAQPLPPLAPSQESRSYRELLSSSQASRLWGAFGVAALLFMAATLALAQAPSRRGEVGTGYPSDTCVTEARPLVLDPGAAVPQGQVGIELEIAEGQTLAIDGCLLRGELGKPLSLAVARGAHELRASQGSLSTAQTLEVHEGQKVALEVEKAPSQGATDAAGSLVRGLQRAGGSGNSSAGTQGPSLPSEGIDSFDPVETGMLDPVSRDVLESDRAVFGGSQAPQAPTTSDLPLALGLALDGMRAARRRFDAAGTVCAASLANAAIQELGSGTGDPERAEQLAVELLTVTRIRGAQLRGPLRTEREALERLQISPTRRVLSAVEHLAARPDIASCLADLAPKAAQVNELSALALAQLPGVRLPDQPADADDSTE